MFMMKPFALSSRRKMVTVVFALVIAIATRASGLNDSVIETTELPEPMMNQSNVFYISTLLDQEARAGSKNVSTLHALPFRLKNRRRNATFTEAVRAASLEGFNAMIDLYERQEPEILRKGQPITEQKNIEYSNAKQTFQVNFLT